ncbi:MAG: YqhA family protein [Dehalococcoidia bacterium]
MEPSPPGPPAGLATLLTRSRYMMMAAVLAMVAVAAGLFVLAAVIAMRDLAEAFRDVGAGEVNTAELKVGFLQVATLVLKAVVFYLIGTGLYSLFIGPLGGPSATRVNSLTDLEAKIIGVIIVILGTTFLELYQEKGNALDSLFSAAALALAIAGLGLFQLIIRRDEAADRAKTVTPNNPVAGIGHGGPGTDQPS